MILRTVSAIAVLALAPLAASAGDLSDAPATPTVAPAIAPAPAAMDWSGAYAGLSYGSVSGDIDFTPTPNQELNSGTLAGVFAGYQVQRGQLVYGGEVAISQPDGTTLPCCVGTSEISDTVFDIKGRVGYAMGDTLLYGVLGYSWGTYSNVVGDPNDQWDIDGFNYGIGVDYAITENWLIGAEYLVRDLEGSNPFGGGQTVQVDFDSISLRATYKF